MNSDQITGFTEPPVPLLLAMTNACSRPKLPPGGVLFALADDLLADIFTEWIPMEDVCRLDSAVCAKMWRSGFLRLVSTKVLLFLREEINVLDEANLCTTKHRALGAPALRWILKRGIHLASLRLPPSDDIDDEDEKESIRSAVTSLVAQGRLNKLEMIDFNWCTYIKDADISAILSKSYSSMKIIHIRTSLTHENSVVSHIKRCTGLEALAFLFRGSAQLPKSRQVFSSLIKSIVQSCRKLRTLIPVGVCFFMTDVVVQSVATHCRLLAHLDLTACRLVSDEAIKNLAENCKLLQYAGLSRTNITDATVLSLCKNSPRMKCLYLDGCHLLTDVAVLAVAEILSPGLKRIGLNYISAITSGAVETLATRCRELEYIGLLNNNNINDATIMRIAECCSKLEELNIRGCTHVTKAGLEKMPRGMKNLEWGSSDW